MVMQAGTLIPLEGTASQVRSPSLSKALVPFQSLAASMEGTASQGYDIVLVVRGRGQNFTVLSNTNTRELAWPSQDYRGLDLKNKHSFLCTSAYIFKL
uniref:Uncharacterized protein n=1 Tax=Musa acuminata subsp. malaccensis TaxID=214687 RepID=A0A804L1P0_MUSAM